MDDPYHLERFVAAQDTGGDYQRAVGELTAGAKRGHWMWFVFPQIAGLGFSAMSKRYAITSLAEAQAYLAHPVLGPRLAECARILAGTDGRSATDIFGGVDAMKLRSSMTLFAAAAPDEPAFRAVIDKYFDGKPDEATLERLVSRLRVRCSPRESFCATVLRPTGRASSRCASRAATRRCRTVTS